MVKCLEGKKTFRITTFSIMAHSITALSIMTHNITTLSIMIVIPYSVELFCSHAYAFRCSTLGGHLALSASIKLG